jgi:ribosomal peptide maturation radical SAM protein 1
MSERDPGPSLNVAFVEAPFGPAIWPSIGTSLLKSELMRNGHRASVLYANHFLLPMIGPAGRTTLSVYQQISDQFGVHLGEWVFVDEAFPDRASATRDEEFLARLVNEGLPADLIEEARRLKARAWAFLDMTMARFDWSAFDVVGFANTFSQLNASIGMARRLRKRFPGLPFIVGGSGCSDDMGVGVAEATDLFKAVALGEADEIIVDLCKAVCSGDDRLLAEIPGIAFRCADGEVVRSPPKHRVTQMDDIAIPQYDDYYATLPAAYRPELPFYLPVEASRGCWWGAKHHCVFCGLNPDRMSYYAKSPERFLAEVDQLRRLYAPLRFMAVDNIMPREYYKSVVPQLRAVSGDAEFFFEVKSNFREEQLREFSVGKVVQIQPGVESLCSHVLSLMKKGITGPANILTLRLCEEFGIRAHWSILHGFHNETADDYRGMAEVAKRLFHLRPPLGLFRAEVERFAPMFRFPVENGLRNLRPSHWYDFCYPVPAGVLAKMAYRFDADPIDDCDPVLQFAVFEILAPVVVAWRQAYASGHARLFLTRNGNRAVVERRQGLIRKFYQLSPQALDVYDLFDRPRNVERSLPGATDGYLPTPYLDPAFARACARAADSTREVQIESGDPAALYQLLLLHGLVVQEAGLAVAVACQPYRQAAAPPVFERMAVQ